MHIQKIKLHGGHYTRLRAEAVRSADHYENNVDLSKSHENITLQEYLEADTEKLKAEIKSRGVIREIRPDAVGLLDCVCSMPKDEPISRNDREAVAKWGEDVMEAFLKAYGLERNDVIGAVIHMDETHPHIHISVLPIQRDEKGAHLSAKKVNNQSALKRLHDSVAEQMKEKGYKGSYVNENEADRGKGKETLKALKERTEAEMERDKARAERDYAKDEAADYKDTAELWREEAKNSQAEAQVWSQKSMEAKVEADMNIRYAKNALAVRDSIEGGTRYMEKLQRMVDYITHNTDSRETAPIIEEFYKGIVTDLMKWMDDTPDRNNALTLGQGFRNMEADRDKRRRSIEDYER